QRLRLQLRLDGNLFRKRDEQAATLDQLQHHLVIGSFGRHAITPTCAERSGARTECAAPASPAAACSSRVPPNATTPGPTPTEDAVFGRRLTLPLSAAASSRGCGPCRPRPQPRGSCRPPDRGATGSCGPARRRA